VIKLKQSFLIFVLSIFCFGCLSPSDSTVKSEFLRRYPQTEIVSTELIFEQDYKVVYLIKYKENNKKEILTSDFALKHENLMWKWCDDQTERKCK